MSTQEMVTRVTDVNRELEAAKRYIKAKDYRKAKMILNDLDHPTATRWLEKIEEIEMFNENATPVPRATNKPAVRSNLLAEVTGVFLTHDWTVNAQMGNTVIIEKKKAPSSLGAALLLALFGLIGMFIVLVAIANAKVERITLNQDDDGTVRLSEGKSQGMVIHSSQDAVKIAQSVKKGATYAATLALGIGATIFWMVVLH
jgi:hypothetical protein